MRQGGLTRGGERGKQEEVTHNKHAKTGEHRVLEPSKEHNTRRGGPAGLRLQRSAPQGERSSTGFGKAGATQSGQVVKTQPRWEGQMAMQGSSARQKQTAEGLGGCFQILGCETAFAI